MVVPMIDPQQLAKMQEVSKLIKARIVANYKENSVLLELTTDQVEAKKLIPSLVEQFSSSLATQLSTFFAIAGELTEVGEKPKKTV